MDRQRIETVVRTLVSQNLKSRACNNNSRYVFCGDVTYCLDKFEITEWNCFVVVTK